MPTPPINGVTVCVDYSDYLHLTLPYNRHHFDKFVVVTAASDRATKELAKKQDCIVVQTEAMYADGLHFNKWAAAAEGFDTIPRDGWFAYIDADILLPRSIKWDSLKQGDLYVPYRRQIKQLCENLPQERYWPIMGYDSEAIERASYCQIWHAEDTHVPKTNWQDTEIAHAGGRNRMFQNWWDRRIRAPFDVLHLSRPRTDWCGRVSRYLNGEVNPVARRRFACLSQFIRSCDDFDQI